MGICLYVENRIHDRVYASVSVNESLDRFLERCGSRQGRLIDDIDPYGDTMFNWIQLQRFVTELDAVAREHDDLKQDVELLKELALSVIRQYGYLWFSGD